MEIGKASGHFASIQVCDDHRHKIFMLVKGFDFFTRLFDDNLGYYFAAGSSGSLLGERWLFIRALAVVVLRFEGWPGRQATLDARWRLVGKDGNELALKRSTINEPVAGQGYQALVQGMNRLLSSLAREIASEIRSRADTSARSQS